MLSRYRGLIAIGLVLAAVGAWLSISDPISTSKSAAAPVAAAASDMATMRLPDGAVSWSSAEAAGTTGTYDWGDRCDQSTGQLAMSIDRPYECFARFAGDNGGATATGITRDTIRVVAYETNDAGLTNLINTRASSLSPTAGIDAQRGFAEILGAYYETYGRRVEVVPFKATGPSADGLAAVADAETIARELSPFLVIGGPLLTNAFAERLASLKVMCWNCAPGQSNAWFVRQAPYVWDLQKNPEQNGLMVNEYIGKRLMGKPAIYAGDPALQTKQRVFGSLHITLGKDSEEIGDALRADQARYGFEYAVDAAFDDIGSVGKVGRDLITRLKDGGVTTIVYTGDPLSPGTFTKIATEQNYFPEWVITGTALTDTAVLPRTYDQRQWAHAFGVANLFARPASGRSTPVDMWRWFFGNDPPIPGAALSLSWAPYQVLFLGLQFMGPNATPEHFRDALFLAPALEGNATTGQFSFGSRGFWPQPDYTGIDDQAEVWWDATAVGVDELGTSGTGMWRWMKGGARVLPGAWDAGDPALFDPGTAVTMIDDSSAPAPKPYPPLRRS